MSLDEGIQPSLVPISSRGQYLLTRGQSYNGLGHNVTELFCSKEYEFEGYFKSFGLSLHCPI